MNTRIQTMFIAAVVASRIQASSGFSVTSTFLRSSTKFGQSCYHRRQYSKTTLSMGLQTAIVGMPNVGKVGMSSDNVQLVSNIRLTYSCFSQLFFVDRQNAKQNSLRSLTR